MARCSGGFPIGDTMFDLNQHFAAHPYYLLGAKNEKLHILELLKNNEQFNNIQDVIDYLEGTL
jgi:hypothetical protein